MYDAFDRRGMLHDLYATDNGGGGGNIPKGQEQFDLQ